MNDALQTSNSTLSLAKQWGFFHVSGSLSSTKGKDMLVSKGLPIDHVFANSRMRELSLEAEVNHGVTLSDHYAITGSFVLPTSLPLAWCWPSVPVLSPSSFAPGPWGGSVPSTRAQWTAKATLWLSSAFGVTMPTKMKVGTSAVKIETKSGSYLPGPDGCHESLGRGLFHEFWGQLESWPSEGSLQAIRERLEDHWIAYLPRCEAS